MFFAATLMILTANPVPPPLAQYAADCYRPVYASDRLICSDPELLKLDQRVYELFMSAAAARDAQFREDQSDWVRKRALCAFKVKHRECLVKSIKSRVKKLEKMQ